MRILARICIYRKDKTIFVKIFTMKLFINNQQGLILVSAPVHITREIRYSFKNKFKTRRPRDIEAPLYPEGIALFKADPVVIDTGETRGHQFIE